MTIIRMMVLTFFAGFLIGCSPKQDESKIETTTIKVETIQCDMCVSNITEALKQTDGVQSVNVDLKEKIATVQYLPAKINLSSLEQTIANAGYDANNTKRNMEAYEKLDECCKIDGGH